MVNASNQIYRITYEAFSKFSNNLNSCRTFADIEKCFRVNLKYLFNFHMFRASYHHGNAFIHLGCARGKAVISEHNTASFLPYEEALLNQSRPLEWKAPFDFALPPEFDLPAHECPVLNAWNFFNEDRQIIVSVLSGNSKAFTQRDITFLKLVAESLESKLLEICLIKELDEKNRLISRTNFLQQEIIEERTKEIADKNKVLLEISMLNAHTVREPLSRILGLIGLVNSGFEIDLATEILPRLTESSQDLDRALQNVIERTTNDLLKLKA